MLGGRPPNGIGVPSWPVLNQGSKGTVRMNATMIGLDIAKTVFQVYGEDGRGQPVLGKRLGRGAVEPFFAKLPPATIGIEACGSSHHWARRLQALGHAVRLIPAAYVRPFVKRNSNAWLMATVALGIVLENVTLFLFGKEPRNYPSVLADAPLFEVAGVAVSPLQVVIPAIGLAAAAVLQVMATRTRIGRAITKM